MELLDFAGSIAVSAAVLVAVGVMIGYVVSGPARWLTGFVVFATPLLATVFYHGMGTGMTAEKALGVTIALACGALGIGLAEVGARLRPRHGTI